MFRTPILSLLLCAAAAAQPRVNTLTAGRSAAEAPALTAYRANPLTLRVRLDATRPTATGLEAITAEIRASLADAEAPLATVTLSTPTGAGPFDLTFSGAQTNQELAGKPSRQCWLLVYAQDDSGGTSDIFHAGKLTLLEHGASQTAAAPPNVVGPLSRREADALSAALHDFDAPTAWVDHLEAATSSTVAGGVILRRNGQEDAFYPPLEYSDSGRGEALRTALIAAQLTPLVPATVELRHGRFALADDVTLVSANPARNSGVLFGPDSAIVYADPEDAAADYQFFSGTRNVLNFGAIPAFSAGGTVDNLAYFQAAANSLATIYPDPPYVFPVSGRWLRTGAISIPPGSYGLSGTWEVSPTVLVSGAGAGSTALVALPSFAPSAMTEKFMVVVPTPVGVDTNNMFYSGIRDLTITGQRSSSNPGISGVRIGGGQGTHLGSVLVTEMGLRGVVADGCQFSRLWVSNITRGPGLEWTGGGTADHLSVEHVNEAGLMDGKGDRYPAMLLLGQAYNIGFLQGEEGGEGPQTHTRALDVLSLTVGTFGFGIGPTGVRDHLLLDIRGSSAGVQVLHFYGAHSGYFPRSPGTLVRDTSTNSPAGSGVPFTVTGADGRYCQQPLPTLAVSGSAGIGGAAPGGAVAGTPTALNVTGVSGLGTLRIDGTNTSDTIYTEQAALSLTTSGGPVRLGVGPGAAQIQINRSGQIILTLPTSAAGLPTGALWNDSGAVKVAP